MRDYGLVETAKIMRQTLKAAFPGTKFSVRSSSYSGGSSVNVSWFDGPTSDQVDPIIKAFKSAGFDGQTDSSYYTGDMMFRGEPSSFSSGYVSGERRYTKDFMTEVAEMVCAAVGATMPTITDTGTWGASIQGIDNVRVPFRVFCDRETGEVTISHCDWEDEYLNRLIVQAANKISKQDPVEGIEVPKYIPGTSSYGAPDYAPELAEVS